MPASIVALTGTHSGRSFALGELGLVLGRNPDCSVVLASANASRRHAEIRRGAHGFVLIDLGSANGTFVNGERLAAPHTLRPGDEIRIGDETFRFDEPLPAPAMAPFSTATPTLPVGADAVAAPFVAPPTPQSVRRAGLPRWLLVLALVGLVMAVACVGGAVVVSRAFLPSAGQRPTAAPGDATAAPVADATPAATRPPAADSAKWTVLVYLDGDNNLEADALGDLNEMELVGSNSDVRIVVQLDRIRGETREDDDTNGDWTTTKRFLVERDDDPVQLGSRELEDLGELNMGDPQTLADFVVWGVQSYPAEHYALVLWDHGSSWAGIAFDDTDGEDGIAMPELDAALRTAQSQTGVERLDLIGFDACLMAQLDVLQTVAPYAATMVASAELEPNEGWAWDTWLRALAENPAQDRVALAREIVDSYRRFYEGSDDDTVTLSAFDLTRAEPLVDALDTFAQSMAADLATSYPAIAEARSYAEVYNPPRPEEFNAVDLGHFAALVQERGAPGGVAGPARELGDALEGARIAAWSGGFHANHSGLTVFFPQVAELYPEFYAQASPTPQQTQWDEFLIAFHSAGTNQITVPQISDLSLSDTTVGVNNPLSIQGTVSGADIAYVFFFVGVPSADDNGVQLTDIDYIYPPGSVPNDAIPSWDAGDNAVSVTWSGTQWGLSNGTDTIPVLLGPAKYGTDLYGVEGIYTVQGTGDQTDAGLLFRFEQGTPVLQAIYGFPKGTKQEVQPYEITPSTGDSFTALLRSYTVKGDQLEPGQVRGDTITFGTDTPTLTRLPANSGAYVAGLLVRDIAGRFSYQYHDITVDNSGAGPNQPPNPTAAPATGGSQVYQNADLGFRLEYPADWETLDTGNSQIYVYDSASGGNIFVSVDVYSTKQAADAANLSLLESFLESVAKQPDATHAATRQASLAGERGPSVEYSYTNDDGVRVSGVATVITSERSGLSYLISLQAPADAFDGQAAIFETILNSLTID